jgi:ketosteroid isomerase-like protein
MKRTISLLAAVFAMLAAPAAAKSVAAAVMAPISAMLAATNADKGAELAAYYTADAVVVDEFAPYAWTGPTAAAQWWAGVDKQMAQMGTKTIHAVAQPIKHYDVTGDSAYVVVPLSISYVVKGKPGHETGLFTLTLRRSGGTWKIATQTWATATSTM